MKLYKLTKSERLRTKKQKLAHKDAAKGKPRIGKVSVKSAHHSRIKVLKSGR